MCAFRAPIPLTVAMAYLQVICRIVQLVGAALKKRLVARIGYIAATLFMIIMFFAVMIDQSDYVTFYWSWWKAIILWYYIKEQ